MPKWKVSVIPILILILILIALVIVVVNYVPVTWSLGAAAEGDPEPGRPECPRHKGVFVIDAAGNWAPTAQEIGTADEITLVPEYHDCQRLVVKGEPPKKYGSMIGIFASITAGAVGNPPGFVPPPPPPSPTGGTLSVTLNFPVIIALAPPVSPPLNGTESAVVTILNYDAEYAPLHILQGYSCLYVYHQGAKWAAHIMFVGAETGSDVRCKAKLDAGATQSWPLNVVPTYDPAPLPVTRWQYDATADEFFIGVQCGSSWCEVYNDQLASHTESVAYAGRPKGSYDEQTLAEKGDPASDPDGLVPGPAVGRIFPIGDLAGNTPDDFKTWRQVAEVSLSEDSPAYKGKYNFMKSDAAHGAALISLCKGTKGECNIPWIKKLFMNKCKNDTELWWSRIESPDGTEYRCVVRRDPMVTDAPLPPGVVRWRWKIKDEGMWTRCPGGCCEVT